MPDNRIKSYGQNLVLLLLVFFAFFYGMTSYALLDNNEGLYAEIAREMFTTGHYLIPHLNYVPYLEKPPLLYWLIAASYHLFGVSTFAARLIPSLSSAIICFALYFFTRRTPHKEAGWLAAVILASSLGFIIIGRFVLFDMLLTAQLTIALLLFYRWEQQAERKYLLWLAYSALAGAFLTKGLVAVALAGGIALFYLWLRKAPFKKILAFFNPVGLALFLLIVLPWHLLASLKQTNFAWDYFINEQFYRFLNMRVPHDYHNGPWYYYLLPIIVYLLPWNLLIPVLFRRNANASTTESSSLRLFLWLWLLIPLLFFSISRAKADYYMVVSMPALALLLGLKINEYLQHSSSRALTLLFCGYALLLLSTVGYIIYQHKMAAAITPALHILFIALVLYSLGGLLLIYLCRSQLLACLLTAGFIIPVIIFYIHFRASLQTHYSQIELADYIHAHNSRQVYLYQDYEEISSLLFLLQHRLPIIDSTSLDLYFGSRTDEAKNWFISSAEFLRQAKNTPVYVTVLKRKITDFQQRTVPLSFYIVAQSDSTYLLSNTKADQ